MIVVVVSAVPIITWLRVSTWIGTTARIGVASWIGVARVGHITGAGVATTTRIAATTRVASSGRTAPTGGAPAARRTTAAGGGGDSGGGNTGGNPGGGGGDDDDNHHHEPTASEVAPGKYQVAQWASGDQAISKLKEQLDTASTFLTWASVGLFVATTVALIAAPALIPALSLVGALVTGTSMMITYVQDKNEFVDPTQANESLAAGAVSLALGNQLAGNALGRLIGDAKGANLITTALSRTWSAVSTIDGAVASK